MCLVSWRATGRRCRPLFKPGEKVDTAAYYKVLRYTVLPWLKSTYPSGNYTWTQMAHRATPPRKSRISVVPTWPISARRHVAKFESGFKPLDFSFGASWRVMPARHLTQIDVATASHCRGLGQLDRGVYQEELLSVRRRVEAVIANNGGHIE
ncbi:Uncharacterized protein FKW44_021315 [Caligus rogercresseyi]|uniref:Uncharacterized protein n=1 Tax=Caligus rogercresseyi TaxID=217165 RepID=A0A7T8GR24_CALRO|nr:Uncharacterized protein FKW44_021315 [Caligus rogercresseyi]